MATTGFNLRSTSGYVTDPADTTYVVSDLYPTTRGGRTFGFDASPSIALDRSTTVDPRLAGSNGRLNNGTQLTFRLDLDAPGTYDVRLAIGDPFHQLDVYLEVKDGSTVLLTIDKPSGNADDEWFDATGVGRSAAAWPGSNLPATLQFAGTQLVLVIGTPTSQSDFTLLSHVAAVLKYAGGLVIDYAGFPKQIIRERAEGLS